MLTQRIQGEDAMLAFGGVLAKACKAPLVLYLQGQLGAGKTTLARGLLRGFGYEGAVRSPTFTLLEPYEFENMTLVHLDLYRLGHGEELEFLGLREYCREDTIILVEWPERGEGFLPQADVICFIKLDVDGRELTFTSNSDSGRKFVGQLG